MAEGGHFCAGDSHRIGAVRVGEDRRADRGRTTVVGCHPRGASAWQNLGAKCQSSSKSHTPDVATESVTRVRRSPRRRHLEHSGRHHARFAGSYVEVEEARATLPMRMGGLGLRSATRCAEAACWASWADALYMVGQRNPEVADMVVRTVSQREQRHQGCLTELHQAGARLDRERFWWRPSWQALRDGARPEEHVVGEPGEWQHGWQYWASSISDSYFRKTSLLPVRPAASRAHLRSHSGPDAGAALACAPTAPEYTILTCSG